MILTIVRKFSEKHEVRKSVRKIDETEKLMATAANHFGDNMSHGPYETEFRGMIPIPPY